MRSNAIEATLADSETLLRDGQFAEDHELALKVLHQEAMLHFLKNRAAKQAGAASGPKKVAWPSRNLSATRQQS